MNRDLRAFFRPLKSLLGQLARTSGGRIPLWNPFLASGQPFAANPQHELFHPGTWLFFVVPFEWAMRLEVMVPPLVAAGGTYFLLRTLGRSSVASTFGALSWAFGGYTLSSVALLPILIAAAPIPFVLGFTVRIARGGGLADAAGLATSLGLVGLAFEPTTLMGCLMLVAAALLVGSRQIQGARPGLEIVRTGLAGLLGIALAAAALLPGVALSRKTSREQGLVEAAAARWSTPPVRVVELLFPHALGHVERADESWFWAAPLYPDRRFPFVMSLYTGLLSGVLGAFAWSRGWRALWPWAAAGLLGALLACGENLPFFHLARAFVPFLSEIRYPEKFVLPALFSWSVAASFGFDAVLFGRAEAKTVERLLFGIAGVGAGVCVGALGWDLLGPDAWSRLGAPPAVAADVGATIAFDSLLVAFWAASGAAILHRLPGNRRRAAGALLTLAAADLILAGLPLLRTSPVDREKTPPPVLRAVLAPANGPVTLFHLAAWTSRGLPTGILASPPIPAFWSLATTLENDFDLTELSWSAEATRRFWDVVNRDPKLMGTLLYRRGVTAVVRATKKPGAPLEAVFPAAARPFAAAVSRVERFDGGSGWVSAILRLGDGAREAACVDRAEGALPESPSPATVRVAGRTPVHLDLEVQAEGPEPAFVAIAQTWDTGWAARLDGSPIRLVRTDLSLSGVVVPPGRHRVTLDYRDPWVTRGIAISLAAAATTALLALLGWRRGRRRRRPPRGPVPGRFDPSPASG